MLLLVPLPFLLIPLLLLLVLLPAVAVGVLANLFLRCPLSTPSNTAGAPVADARGLFQIKLLPFPLFRFGVFILLLLLLVLLLLIVSLLIL